MAAKVTILPTSSTPEQRDERRRKQRERDRHRRARQKERDTMGDFMFRMVNYVIFDFECENDNVPRRRRSR